MNVGNDNEENMVRRILDENQSLKRMPKDMVIEMAIAFKINDPKTIEPKELLTKVKAKIGNVLLEEKYVYE